MTLSLPEFSSQTNEAIKHLVSPFRNVVVHKICNSYWQQSFSKQDQSSSECFCFSKAFSFALLCCLRTPDPCPPFLLILTGGTCTSPLGNKHHKRSILSYNAEKSHILTEQLHIGTKMVLLVHCRLWNKEHFHPSTAQRYSCTFYWLAGTVTGICNFCEYLFKMSAIRYHHKIWGCSFYQMLWKPDNFAFNHLTMLQLGEQANCIHWIEHRPLLTKAQP